MPLVFLAYMFLCVCECIHIALPMRESFWGLTPGPSCQKNKGKQTPSLLQ